MSETLYGVIDRAGPRVCRDCGRDDMPLILYAPLRRQVRLLFPKLPPPLDESCWLCAKCMWQREDRP